MESFAKRNLTNSNEESLKVDRESFWIDVLRSYKRTLGKPELLSKEMSVSLKNKEGLDGGAMKIAFFSMALKEVRKRLFE